jgi:Ca2+-binding EF-hand superfamily protein
MAATKYIALIAGAILASTAMAGDKEHKDHSMQSAASKFERLDSDQDRSISKSEAASDSELTAVFASVDADGDGKLSQSEYTAHLASKKTPRQSTSSYE